MDSDPVDQPYWLTAALPAFPALPDEPLLHNDHTALRTKISADFPNLLVIKEEEKASRSKSRDASRKKVVNALRERFANIEKEGAATDAYKVEWKAIVQQATVMLNMTILISSMPFLKEMVLKGQLDRVVSNYDDIYMQLSDVFGAIYDCWTQQSALSEEEAMDVKTVIMKAVLDIESPATNLDAANSVKQALVSSGLFGPEASGNALLVHSALEKDSQSSSLFDKLILETHAHPWLRKEWKQLNKIKSEAQNPANSLLLAKRIRFNDDGSITDISKSSGTGRKRKANTDQPEHGSASKRAAP